MKLQLSLRNSKKSTMKLQLSLRNNKQVNNESAAANDSKHVIKQRMSIMTNEHTHTASILGSELHWTKKFEFLSYKLQD